MKPSIRRTIRSSPLVMFAIVLLMLTIGASQASADTTTITLGTGNSGGLDCCTGPYATVTITTTSSTTATVTFNSLTNGGFTYLLAGNSAADLNVNATAFTVGTITGSNSLSGFTPGPFTNAGAGTADGFGTFNLNIDSFDGFGHSSTTISFTLTDTSGTWSSASNVLVGNAGNNTAAIHGFACATPCNGSTSTAFATGFASNGNPVPEPASMLLFGSGLVALGIKLRRKPRNPVAV